MPTKTAAYDPGHSLKGDGPGTKKLWSLAGCMRASAVVHECAVIRLFQCVNAPHVEFWLFVRIT